MPARLVQVTVVNNSMFPVIWQDDGRHHGDWQDPWYPSKLQTLMPGKQGTFRMESDGIMTGCEGWAYFRVGVPPSPTFGDRTEHFNLAWDRPFWMVEPFNPSINQIRSNPEMPHLVEVRTRIIGPMESGDQLSEVVLGLYLPYTLVGTFLSDAFHNHIRWVVEVVNSAAVGTILQPLYIEPSISDLSFTTGTYINSTQDLIWEALVRPALTVKYWYDMRIESPWNVGTEVHFVPKESDRPSERGTVLEYSPPRLLSYTLKSDPCDDCKESRVTFKLEPQDDGRVKLTMTHDRIASGRGTKRLHDTWRQILLSLTRMLEAEQRPIRAAAS